MSILAGRSGLGRLRLALVRLPGLVPTVLLLVGLASGLGDGSSRVGGVPAGRVHLPAVVQPVVDLLLPLLRTEIAALVLAEPFVEPADTVTGGRDEMILVDAELRFGR